MQGAQLVSWRRPNGQEQLYLSDRAVYAPGHPVRGGVPVVFPQFECRGPLPRHGFARTASWGLAQVSISAADALAVFSLTDTQATQAVWPHAFSLELTIRFCANRLDLELTVDNTGPTSFKFTTALHTYLRVQDLDQLQLNGLHRLRYQDCVRGTEQIDSLSSLKITSEIDRIYFDAARELVLVDGSHSKRISTSGFLDAVVWNPGADKCAVLADMPADGYRHMLCVEAAAIGQPIELTPGGQWVARQSIECLDSDQP